MDFLIVNGEVVSKAKANLTGFLWNEPFIMVQKLWFGFGGIPLFQENLKQIEKQFRTFNQQLPNLFKNERELFRLTKRMLNKNKYYRSGYVSFQFFISPKEINSLITCCALPEFNFPISEQGLLVNFAETRKNSQLKLGAYKCHNLNLWNAAKAEVQNSQLNSSILLNEKEMVCEGISSNIFMIKDGILVTPSLESGCYNDVLRSAILSLAKKLNLKTIEVPEIKKDHLFEMDEVFFLSEEQGVNWILGIENKRFVHELSEQIHEELNIYLKNRVS